MTTRFKIIGIIGLMAAAIVVIWLIHQNISLQNQLTTANNRADSSNNEIISLQNQLLEASNTEQAYLASLNSVEQTQIQQQNSGNSVSDIKSCINKETEIFNGDFIGLCNNNYGTWIGSQCYLTQYNANALIPTIMKGYQSCAL